MKCFNCNCLEDKVIDSRLSEDGCSIRRRRECLKCGKRFTTYEKIETPLIFVIKNNGNRQPFNSEKLKGGLLKACEKRPVPIAEIDGVINDIEKTLHNNLVQEISSKQLGEMVMERLKKLDDVAYVRFASVHREFKDITMMYNEINDIMKNKK